MFAFLGALVYGAFKLYEHLMRERESDDFIFEEIYDPLIIKKNGIPGSLKKCYFKSYNEKYYFAKRSQISL